MTTKGMLRLKVVSLRAIFNESCRFTSPFLKAGGLRVFAV
jgi:hypothetical protein